MLTWSWRTEVRLYRTWRSGSLANGRSPYSGIRLAKGSSGVDAARELYERHALRCIFVSANLDEPTRAALMPYDPIEFLGKPVLPFKLQRALKKAEGLTE